MQPSHPQGNVSGMFGCAHANAQCSNTNCPHLSYLRLSTTIGCFSRCLPNSCMRDHPRCNSNICNCCSLRKIQRQVLLHMRAHPLAISLNPGAWFFCFSPPCNAPLERNHQCIVSPSFPICRMACRELHALKFSPAMWNFAVCSDSEKGVDSRHMTQRADHKNKKAGSCTGDPAPEVTAYHSGSLSHH